MATLPFVFCSTMSLLPSPLKSPVPSTCQLGPGLATTADWLIWPPLISQTATLPLSFCSAMSVLPSPLKSPTPSTCQEGPGLATTSPDRSVAPCICHTATEPLVFCNKISEASEAPPLKNEPVHTCNQLEPGSAPSKAAAESVGVVEPLACHNPNWPLVLCKLISKSGLATKTATLLVAELPPSTDQVIARLLGFKAAAEANVTESSSV